MKEYLAVLALLCLPFPVFALSSEVHITKDGKAVMNGVKVMQLAGQTFFTRLYWGDAFVRLTVKTNSKTIFYRATGEKTNLGEVAVNDILNLEGELEPGGSDLVIVPKTIKNSSVEKEQSILSGKVASLDLGNNKFTLDSKSKGIITVSVDTNTEFTKGNRRIDLGRVKVNDSIIKADGDYDFKTKTLSAKKIVVYVDLNTFKPKVHEGAVESIRGTTLPTDISIKIGKIVYTVYLDDKAEVINKERKKIVLSRFEAGDKIRLYGVIREIDEPVIDAEVIRNMDL